MNLARRVVSRYLREADQAPGQRTKDRKNTNPINRPKGIDRDVAKDNGRTENDHIEETVSPERKDIQPKDVFSPNPNNINVLNLAQTGKDQSKALKTQIPKDKGYDTVKNLSQYLIRTEGGGGTKPVGN